MKIKIQPGSLLYKVVFFFGVILVKLWLKTLRVKRNDPKGLVAPDSKAVFIGAFWHNRILSFPSLFHKKLLKRTYAMASRSRDGQVISDVLAAFKIQTIRGSAHKAGKSKGGAAALIGCIRTLREGNFVVIIPDGPRGPRYSVQPGIVMASIKSKIPVQTMSLNCKSCWKMKSWDGLQIPKPFSKVELVLGESIQFEGGIDEESLTQDRETLREALMKITVDPEQA